MSFEDDFPSITLLAKPSIHKSPFNDDLMIAYPYLPDGAWIHKEDLGQHCRDNQKIDEAIQKAVLGVKCDDDKILIAMQNYIMRELGL